MANISIRRRPGLTVVFFLFLACNFGLFSAHAGHRVFAQDSTPTPTPTPKSEEELKLEEQERLATLRKSIAEANKATAEANKAEFDAKFPKPSSSPLAGTTTVSDNAIIESQMVAYLSLAKAANRVVTALAPKIKPGAGKAIAIYNEKDIQLLLSYKVANNQLGIIKDEYCTLLAQSLTNGICPAKTATPSPPSVPSIAPLSIAESFLGAFVDLTALLRTNVEIKGQTFDIDEGPLAAEVFRAARRSTDLSGIKLYYPFVFPPDTDPKGKSDILGYLQQIRILRVEAEKVASGIEDKNKDLKNVSDKIDELKNAVQSLPKEESDATDDANKILAHCKEVAGLKLDILDKIEKVRDGRCRRLTSEERDHLLKLQGTIADLRDQQTKAAADLASAQAKQNKLKGELDTLVANLDSRFQGDAAADAVARLKAINAQFDSFVTSLIQVNAATGINSLTDYVRTENLTKALPPNSYWLQLKVVKAGGNNRIKTNLIVDIFTGGNRVSHSGGVIVQYHLFDPTGQSVASDTIADYTNYIKAGKIKDATHKKPDPSHPEEDTDDGP